MSYSTGLLNLLSTARFYLVTDAGTYFFVTSYRKITQLYFNHILKCISNAFSTDNFPVIVSRIKPCPALCFWFVYFGVRAYTLLWICYCLWIFLDWLNAINSKMPNTEHCQFNRGLDFSKSTPLTFFPIFFFVISDVGLLDQLRFEYFRSPDYITHMHGSPVYQNKGPKTKEHATYFFQCKPGPFPKVA